ncbi:MAG: glycerophosphodiester phosphodiesterase [Acidobacteria bacterium]|nr:glycerophosphodiester phosphodiesterase [Acidobacteriota bacterium]
MKSRFRILALILPLIIGTGLLIKRATYKSMQVNGMVAARPWIIAHRGGAGLWPENTLVAFEGAVGLGVDALEMDVWPTKDGVWVLHHDEDVGRTSNGHGPVSGFDLEALSELDFGYQFAPESNYPFRGQGLGVLTLAEVLLKFDDIPMSIEVKTPDKEPLPELVSLLKKFRALDRCVISSFYDEIIVALRKLEPNLLTSPTKSETKRHIVGYMMGVDRLFQPFGQVYQLPVEHEGRRILTKSFVDNCHERGQLVWAWTIDDAQEMGELLEMGIDGLITNRPDIAIQTVRGGDIVDSI